MATLIQSQVTLAVTSCKAQCGRVTSVVTSWLTQTVPFTALHHQPCSQTQTLLPWHNNIDHWRRGAQGAKQEMCEPARLSVLLSNHAGDADQVTHSPDDRSSQHLQEAWPHMGLISHLPLVAPIILPNLSKWVHDPLVTPDCGPLGLIRSLQVTVTMKDLHSLQGCKQFRHLENVPQIAYCSFICSKSV